MEASGSDSKDYLDRESEIGSEASKHAERLQFEGYGSGLFSLEKIIVKDGQQNKLDERTYEGIVGKINPVHTKNGNIKDGEDESFLSKPPGFEGQRFEDMGTSSN
ncbi:hypothetical protein L1987_23094 [Smallanthus sonchifolius]|uniref:Uncharacterized protein n=1 Tax=Smallanthus sonchifolius TaxID=185202 RepID=A0ACB9IIF1_9ASTR|nr:hypothetical protein L1987_23094 [Smallanthus sonchifolius]